MVYCFVCGAQIQPSRSLPVSTLPDPNTEVDDSSGNTDAHLNRAMPCCAVCFRALYCGDDEMGAGQR